MGKKRDPSINPKSLEGHCLGQYVLREFVAETKKKFIFRGNHQSLAGDFCIKLLKPGVGAERLERFLQEADNLTQLTHPNIERIFDAGECDGYHYLASKFIKGENLGSGQKFSLDEILEITDVILGALDYAHAHRCTHTDVKPTNAMLEDCPDKPLSERIHVIDFGPWYEEPELRNHVSGTALIAQSLLGRRKDDEKKIPQRLERILDNASRRNYETPGEFRDAITKYRRGVTRRKSLKMVGSAAAALALIGTPTALMIRRHLTHLHEEEQRKRHENSIEFIAEKIRGGGDEFGELGFRLAGQKLKALIESGKIPKNYFFYAVLPENNSLSYIGGDRLESGFFVREIWTGFRLTGDEQFKKWGDEYAGKIVKHPDDDFNLSRIRFFHAYALGYALTQNEQYRNAALEAAEVMAKRFNPNGNFIQALNVLDDSSGPKIVRLDDTLAHAFPLLKWAEKETQTGRYAEIIESHANTVLSILEQMHGFVARAGIIDPASGKLIDTENKRGLRKDSTIARTLGKIANGLLDAYDVTSDRRFLGKALEVTNEYFRRLRKSTEPSQTQSVCVPPFDFNMPPDRIIEDTFATVEMLEPLSRLAAIPGNETSGQLETESLRALSARRYLSTELEYPGIVKRVCRKIKPKMYSNISLCYVDGKFLDALAKRKTA